jgi:hypothetical protein
MAEVVGSGVCDPHETGNVELALGEMQLSELPHPQASNAEYRAEQGFPLEATEENGDQDD